MKKQEEYGNRRIIRFTVSQGRVDMKLLAHHATTSSEEKISFAARSGTKHNLL
jgi:hypothetical protein